MFPKILCFQRACCSSIVGLPGQKCFPEHRERIDERTLIIPVKSLRLVNAKSLPKKQNNGLLNEISPMMNLMEDTSEIQINQNAIIDANFIDK